MSHSGPRNCTLRLAARSQTESCPGETCPFWEQGGAALPGGCVIDRLHVPFHTPGLAALLLDTRERLEQARDATDPGVGLGF